MVGHRFSGKTSIAHVLKDMHVQVVSIDVCIQTLIKYSPSMFVLLDGWQIFRELEFFIISKFFNSNSPLSILDCGGGVLTLKKTEILLKTTECTIWINFTNKKTWSRLIKQDHLKSSRPPLSSTLRVDEEILISQFTRKRAYKNLANFTIDGKNSNIYNIKKFFHLYDKYTLQGRLKFVRRFSRNSF